MRGYFKGNTPYVGGKVEGKIVLDEGGKDEFLLDTGFNLDVALPEENISGIEVGKIHIETASGDRIAPVFLVEVEIEGKSFDAIAVGLEIKRNILGTGMLEKTKAKIDFETKTIEMKGGD